MKSTDRRPQIFLIERHLLHEERLAKLLQKLNKSTEDALSNLGMKGPSEEAVKSLEPLSEEVQSETIKLKKARQDLLERVNQGWGTEHTTLSQAIRSLDAPEAKDLERQRKLLFDRCVEARSNLIQNQATLFYTFDFHRRYIAGILQSDPEANQYGPDGVQNDLNPGNLYRKSC